MSEVLSYRVQFFDGVEVPSPKTKLV
jgi:hypothetical protein